MGNSIVQYLFKMTPASLNEVIRAQEELNAERSDDLNGPWGLISVISRPFNSDGVGRFSCDADKLASIFLFFLMIHPQKPLI